jgi:hypothetical protein
MDPMLCACSGSNTGEGREGGREEGVKKDRGVKGNKRVEIKGRKKIR